MIFSAFVARREILRAGRGRACRADHRLAVLARGDGAARVRRPVRAPAHLDRHRGRGRRRRDARRAWGSAARTRPVVITTTGVLRHPTPGEFAEHLGLTFHPAPGYMFDLVVVGSGPAGLAAAVYGASEGLDTVSLDARRHRRPGRRELAHRELRRVPERHLRRGARVARRHPGAAARRAPELAVRGRAACASRRAST